MGTVGKGFREGTVGKGMRGGDCGERDAGRRGGDCGEMDAWRRLSVGCVLEMFLTFFSRSCA